MISREVHAVNDWKENSEEKIHVMRDHPSLHKFLIVDGLFGIRKRNDEDAFDQKFPKIMKSIYEKMMLASKSLRKNPQMENLLLEAFVWPKAE